MGASSTIDNAREVFQAETSALRSKVKHLEQQLGASLQDIDLLKDEKTQATSRTRSEIRYVKQNDDLINDVFAPLTCITGT